MKYEVLKRSNLKKNIIIGIVVVLIFSAVILTFTRAKYRTTESIPLIQGTINFLPSDLNIVAMYLNQEGALPIGETDKAPKFGYTLNEEQSFCEVNNNIIEEAQFTYENGKLGFYNLDRKGTKCTVYFDLIPDSEKPIINSLSKIINDDNITISVNATDNVGIYYYYFQIDDGEVVRTEEPTYTFVGLNKDQKYDITIKVKDAFGNLVEVVETVTAGYKAKNVILDNYNTILTRSNFNTTLTETTNGTIYKSLNESQYDDFGEVYYFAGNPTDNWLKFGGFYWRIVRINGDNSIRLIYNGTSTSNTEENTEINAGYVFNSLYDNNMYVGYMYGINSTDYQSTHANINDSDIKKFIDQWYQTNLKNYGDYLDWNSGFCGDRSLTSGTGTGTTRTYYGARYRLQSTKNPSYKCVNNNDLYNYMQQFVDLILGRLILTSADQFRIIIKTPTYDNKGNVLNYNNEYAVIKLNPANVNMEEVRSNNLSLLNLAESSIPVADLFKTYPK